MDRSNLSARRAISLPTTRLFSVTRAREWRVLCNLEIGGHSDVNRSDDFARAIYRAVDFLRVREFSIPASTFTFDNGTAKDLVRFRCNTKKYPTPPCCVFLILQSFSFSLFH